VASEADAARDRVVAARADLAEQLDVLEASARAAVDIPAKIRRSPGKAAAVAGGVGFLALKGPQRVFGGLKRAVRGPSAPLPKAMLPDEIEKSLRRLGSDGDRVRGLLERDFADYAQKAQKNRRDVRRVVLLSLVQPVLLRGTRAALERLFAPGDEGFNARLAEIRGRTGEQVARAREGAAPPEPEGEPPTGV
jgi:hypothetical protein